MPDVVGSAGNFIDQLIDHWYLIVIAILGFIALMLWMDKKNKKIEYHDQIKINHELAVGELKFNPTEIKKIKRKKERWFCFGEIVQAFIRHEDPEIKQRVARAYDIEEIRNLKFDALKRALLKKPEPDYYVHTFLIKKHGILGIPFGKNEIIKLFDNEFTRIDHKTIKIHGDTWLIYRDGFYCSYKYDMMGIISDKTERLMGDLKVDGMGAQQKDYSRIRTDYSHTLDMKKTDIEYEKEKDKMRTMGGKT